MFELVECEHLATRRDAQRLVFAVVCMCLGMKQVCELFDFLSKQTEKKT